MNNKYNLEDLKEGRILVFKNDVSFCGIITLRPHDKMLICVYNTGEWDTLDTIINNKIFDLYDSVSPTFSLLNLMQTNDTDYCVKYRNLERIPAKKFTITKEEIAEQFNVEVTDLQII